MSATTVGFIGFGIMGAPMAANLVGAGFAVRGLAHSSRSERRVRQSGAMLVHTARELVAGTDVVITMLPDSPDVLEVVLGAGGLADLLEAGQIHIDMSTIRPDAAQDIARRLQASGVEVLDAPVSGGEAGAVEGTLSIMVGGDSGTLDRVSGVLEAMGTTITHVGSHGAGQATKAANQLIVAANIEAVAEAIVLLDGVGVRLGSALDALSGGLAGSAVLTRKRQAFLDGEYRPGFRIALHDKDLAIVQNTARQLGLALPMAALVSQLVSALKARGDGNLDHSALLKLARELNGAAQTPRA